MEATVSLRVKYADTKWGEYVAVVGDQPFLGNWENAVALEAGDFPFWSTTIRLPAGNNSISKMCYKFVVCGPDASILLWEPIPQNRSLIIDTTSVACETAFGSLLSNISRGYKYGGGELDPENDDAVRSDQSPQEITPPVAEDPKFAPENDRKLVRYTSPRGIMDDINMFQSVENEQIGATAVAALSEQDVLSGSICGTGTSQAFEISPPAGKTDLDPVRYTSPRGVMDDIDNNINMSQSQEPVASDANGVSGLSEQEVVSDIYGRSKLRTDFDRDASQTAVSSRHVVVRRNLAPDFDDASGDDDRSSVVSESAIDSPSSSDIDVLLFKTVAKGVDHDLAMIGCALEETLAMAAVARNKMRTVFPYAVTPPSNGTANGNGGARTLDDELNDAVVNAHEARRLLQDACERLRELNVSAVPRARGRRRSHSARN